MSPFKQKSSGQPDAGDYTQDSVIESTRQGNDFSSAIQEHMEVIACCGKSVGKVDRVEGNAIKLTKSGSPDGQHHFIPLGWVERVDDHVHLTKNSEEAIHEWKADARSCLGV